jgi:4-amino-4-deoxy-L-arabinose transferase-like glycosyltransferase
MWKYLKVAVTAVSLLVCVLLVALWVRSYSYWDYYPLEIDDEFFSMMSVNGMFAVIKDDVPYFVDKDRDESVDPSEPPWWFESKDDVLVVIAPHWFYATIFAAIAAIPWMKWRFSLRTLLIVMTLFAVFFGMITMSL